MNNERLARVEEHVKALKEDIQEIKSDLKMLIAWRWKLYGTTAAISMICAAVMEIFFGR